jgi:predicted CDP-diglyceride synthetase/phosphatidate cytidylyltransferase
VTTRSALAASVLVLFAAVLALLMLVHIPEPSENALLILLGVLAKSVSDVLAYYFGSSDGSATKQRVIDRLLPGGSEPTGGVQADKNPDVLGDE